MALIRRWFMRAGNRFAVRMYRTLDGRLSSGRRGVTVLLITSPGRRTGRARSTCVRYLDTPEGFVVWGTGSGSRRDPDWFENLRATPRADVQTRSRHVAVQARELTGPERDAAWRDLILTAAPEVTRYAHQAGRTIPVAVLRPVEDADPASPVDSA